MTEPREQRYFAGLTQVCEANSPEEANEFLANGFELIKTFEKTTSRIEQGQVLTSSDIVYVLARAGPKAPVEAPKEASPTPAEMTDEQKLESLKWTAAKSGKCDFSKDAPGELVSSVRAAKEIKTATHRFTASTTNATLFRFKRSSK